jgi:hypothetical protein
LKNIYFGIIPAVAIFVILMNMLFGHLLFVSATEQVVNKYDIYVHLQPEWNSDNKNILFVITHSWNKKQSSETRIEQMPVEHNYNELQYLEKKSYVELKHRFSDCQDEWHPILYRKVVDTVRHEVEYAQGKQLSTDPEISLYPDRENKNYDNLQQQLKVKEGYVQFIPICTSRDFSSYDYSIKTDNNDIGFDVYFVDSSSEVENFFTSEFDYHKELGCFAQNKKSFSGTCDGIRKDGGLLVVFPDEFKPWITKVTVNLYEKN